MKLLSLPKSPPDFGLRGGGAPKNICAILSRYSGYVGSRLILCWYCSHSTVNAANFPLLHQYHYVNKILNGVVGLEGYSLASTCSVETRNEGVVMYVNRTMSGGPCEVTVIATGLYCELHIV